MAENLKTRVGRVIAGSVHALLDRLEDQAPEAMMEQALREADVVIDEVRHELGVVSANRHLAQQQHARLNHQHVSLAAQIDEALLAQRDDLARAGLARQLDIEAQLPVLETTLAELTRQESELQGYAAALLAKQREMHEALSEFRASRAASITNSAANNANPRHAIGSTAEQRMERVTGAFDRLYQRQTGFNGTASGNNLQQAAQLKALDELVRDKKVAERLAQLKANPS